jgi:hypothetical protein
MVMPGTTVQAWKTGSPPKLISRLRETLKRSIALPNRRIEALITAIEPVITARGAAVHYIGDFEEPVPHPAAGQSHQHMITYGAEKASEAVCALRAIYTAFTEHPKPAIRVWADQETAALKQLAGRPRA